MSDPPTLETLRAVVADSLSGRANPSVEDVKDVITSYLQQGNREARFTEERRAVLPDAEEEVLSERCLRLELRGGSAFLVCVRACVCMRARYDCMRPSAASRMNLTTGPIYRCTWHGVVSALNLCQ